MALNEKTFDKKEMREFHLANIQIQTSAVKAFPKIS